jgi:drug/metabolite transporter (DMT)-like permease
MVAIVGACLAWAIDNNLTRKVSAGDPLQIAGVKGIVAGTVNLTIAWMAGATAPSVFTAVSAVGVGVLGYGLSLICFILALRHLGTGRTSAYFSAAPFIGAALAVVVLGDRLTAQFVIATALMGIGVWLHVTEHHEHGHWHSLLEHEHWHSHDTHHTHGHDTESHSHLHTHVEMLHVHPHYPDLHHRHGH